MHKFATILLFAILSVAARSQTFVTTVAYIAATPTYDAKGNLLTAFVQATFVQSGTIEGKDVLVTPAPVCSWDGTDDKTTIEADGIKATYKQVTDLAAAIAYKELGAGTGSQAKAKADAKNVKWTPPLWWANPANRILLASK